MLRKHQEVKILTDNMEIPVAKPTTATNVKTELQEVEKEVQEQLRKPKYSKEELLVIFDEILFSGEYREEVTIKDKLKVIFVTRSAADTAKITRELDTCKFNLVSSMQQYSSLLSICYSIVSYNGRDLSALTVDARKAFLEKLPTVVVSALSDALVSFDLKTEAAMSEMDSF